MSDPLTTIALDGAPNLAVDVLPDNAPGAFQVDTSDVDGPHLLSWGLDGWSNIVCDLTRVGIARGVSRLQGALTRTEAGTCTVQLVDTGRRFDPMVNADAVHPGTPVRVRAWAVDGGTLWQSVLFTGVIGGDGFVVDYQRDGDPLVTFTASDIVAPLARYVSRGRPDPGVGDGDDLLGRVRRVVEELGLPYGTVAFDVDTAYAATLAPSTLARGWPEISAAVDAELGRVWVNALNELVVRARGSQLTGPVRGTLSDWHGETVDLPVDDDQDGTAGPVHCCYRSPVVRFSTESLVNRAIGARRVPRPADGSTPPASAVVQVDDTYSQARWSSGSPVAHEDRSLELRTDGQLRPWAEQLLLASSEPELRVDSVQPSPETAGADAWRALCFTDVGDRWAFRLHPQIGPTVARTLGVLGIDHDITPDGWVTTWHTVEAPTPGVANPSGWFTVDLSIVGEGDVLPPFGGVAA